MNANRISLAEDLRRLGLGPPDIVMVHASVRAVGPVHGGPDEIHLAIADAVAPGGTVMMYVGCEPGFDDVGRGIFSAGEEAAILAHQPAFDFQTARAAREFGALAEFFRSYPDTVCSESVCGRVAARGARARWLTEAQPWNYPFGQGSPLAKLCEAGGKVLLLGSDHDEVTLLHHAEHIAPIVGKRIARYKVPVRRDGERVWVDCEEFDTAQSVHANWPGRAFARIIDDFIARSAGTAFCHSGVVGGADCVVLDAATLVSHAVMVMGAWARGAAPALPDA